MFEELIYVHNEGEEEFMRLMRDKGYVVKDTTYLQAYWGMDKFI